MTPYDPAVELEAIKRNVAGRLQRRWALVDRAEIDAMVAEEAALLDQHGQPLDVGLLHAEPAEAPPRLGVGAAHCSWHPTTDKPRR